MLKKYCSLFLFIFSAYLSSFSQVTGGEIEVIQVHYGMVGLEHDLTGFITYDIFVNVQNPDDFLSAVFGIGDAGGCLGTEPNTSLTFSGQVFQDVNGGFSADNNNNAVWPFLPAVEYDSYITIGKDYDGDNGGAAITYVASCPVFPLSPDGTWDGAGNQPFSDGDFFLDDGAWFALSGDQNGLPIDGRIKVMRVTTNGDIQGCIWTQVFPNGIPSPDSEVNDTTQICFNQPNPCLDQALAPVVTVTDGIDCYGEEAIVDIGAGVGNGDIYYDLYCDDVLITSQTNNFTFTGIQDSVDYYVAVMDELGCRDTSDVFNLSMPDSLIITATLDADVLCFGDLTGEICYTVTGGTPPYNMDNNGAVFNYPDCEENLGCGDYLITVVDDNGCTDFNSVSVSCPELLSVDLESTNVTCNGFCDGTITGTVSGGTDTLNVVWTLVAPATTILDVNAFSGDDISVQDLCPGDYNLTITDDNGCVLTNDDFSITEPDPITTEITTTDETCTGFCDGTITIEAFGGINAVPECEDGLINLCGGFYYCTTTDDNGCTLIDTVEIITPPLITYDPVVINDVTCFGACDGAIVFENLQGGSGDLSAVLLNNVPSETPFDNLCAEMGPFTISIDDNGTGCNILIEDLIINEPDELVVTPIVTDITCFGENDGIIDVSCSGGTGNINITSPEAFACPHTFENMVPGQYMVSIVDSMGCMDSLQVSILEPEILNVNVLSTVNVNCGGACEGEVEAEVSGGTPDNNGNYNWFINGMPVQFPGGLSQLCAGDDQILSVSDLNSCTDSVLFTITEPDPITLAIGSSDITCTGMCDGSLSVVAQGGVGDIEIEFSPDDIDPSNMCEGMYYILGSDSTGCFVQDSVLIGAEVITDMEVTIFTTPVTCWNEGDGTVTAAVTGGFLPINYLWDDPLSQTTVTAVGLIEEVYHVIITDSLGCTISATAIVEPSIGCFYIATALTPNGDAVNDEWLIGGMEFFPHAKIQVFNRWGQALFESIGYDVPWDGTHEGRRLPIADYYYVIKFDENEEPITGTVTIKY